MIPSTADHIETLHELDIELLGEYKDHPGIVRADSLNDHPLFIEGLAELVADHLRHNIKCSSQFALRPPKCKNKRSEEARKFFLGFAL